MTKYFENEIVELKRELIDEVKSEIVAFLNSEGGTVVGFHDEKIKDNLDLKIRNWIQEAFFQNLLVLLTIFSKKMMS